MSQSHSAKSDNQGELDPLLAFNAELSAAESPEKPLNSPSPAGAPPAGEGAPLRLRLDQAERSLDRARIEIASLKSDLATLVTAVDDIKKRLSRRAEVVIAPPVAPVPHKRVLGRAAAMVILFLMIGGVAIWGVASVALLEIPEAPSLEPIETESSMPPAPAPVAVLTPPAVDLQAASAAPAPPPFDSARESASVAQGRPLRTVAERQPNTRTAYVGTLAIDAEPGGNVFINRQVAGHTPVRAENLRAGSHLIWIEREGYRRWTRVVAVAADRVTRVSADLDPLGR